VSPGVTGEKQLLGKCFNLLVLSSYRNFNDADHKLLTANTGDCDTHNLELWKWKTPSPLLGRLRGSHPRFSTAAQTGKRICLGTDNSCPATGPSPVMCFWPVTSKRRSHLSATGALVPLISGDARDDGSPSPSRLSHVLSSDCQTNGIDAPRPERQVCHRWRRTLPHVPLGQALNVPGAAIELMVSIHKDGWDGYDCARIWQWRSRCRTGTGYPP
jgi:hypothetical protein